MGKQEAIDFIVAFVRSSVARDEQESARLRSMGKIKEAQVLENSVAERKAKLKEYDSI